jgi:hypothetical protein
MVVRRRNPRPYRRRFGRRRHRGLKYRKSRNNRPVGSGEFGKIFIKLRSILDILSTGSEVGLVHFIYSDDRGTGYNEWRSFSLVFDKCRICAMKLHYVPRIKCEGLRAKAWVLSSWIEFFRSFSVPPPPPVVNRY